MFKRLLSLLLIITVLVGSLIIAPLSASAGEADNNDVSTGISEDDVTVGGTNSLGAMLASEYEEQEDNINDSGCNIYAVEVNGKTATVDMAALYDAKLIVSIFSEDGKTMYGSGMAEVSADDHIIDIGLEIAKMPQYFLVRAYMLNSLTNAPLCKQYENDYYTQSMQKFFAKTTDDFAEEQVLNLDDSDSNNFLVYNDDTIIVENNDENTNIVKKSDDDTKEYVIENIDEKISSLRAGDIFAYSYGEENNMIVKVSSISIDGTTATIYGSDISLSEAFEYIKIDDVDGVTDTKVDNSALEDGVEYLGSDIQDIADTSAENEAAVDKMDIAATGFDPIDISATRGNTISYKLEKKYGHASVSGTVSGKFEASVKCYYDSKLFKKDEVEFSFAIKTELKITAKLEFSNGDDKVICKLGYIPIYVCPGVYVTFTPSIVIEGKVSAEISGTMKGQIGKKFKNGEFSDNSKKMDFYPQFKVECSFFIGVSLEPKISVVGDVISASATAKAGVKIKSTVKYGGNKPDAQDEIHSCLTCIDGDISAVFELSFKLSLFDIKQLTWTSDPLSITAHIKDFYYSCDKEEFGFGKCPYRKFMTEVYILDTGKKPIQGVDVNGVTTDADGVAAMYLNMGENTITIKKDGKTIERNEDISGSGKLYYIIDFSNNSMTALNSSAENVVGKSRIDSGKCGDNVYYVLYSDGTLEISGTGNMTNYSQTYNPKFYNKREQIKKAIICNGISSIGSHAFYYCTNLTSITIPDSVTSIGEWAFFECTKLMNIKVTSDNKVFDSRDNCNAIIKTETNELIVGCKNTIIPDSVTRIGNYAFGGCESLTNITIPKSVTSLGDSAFYYCIGLTSITIPDSVISIETYAFVFCFNLASVTIPDSVTNIGEGAFYRCKNLTSFTISDSVTSIGGSVLSECSSLKSIKVASGNATYDSRDNCNAIIKTETNELIAGCKNTVIPDSVTSIGQDAFRFCTGLKSIKIPVSITNISNHAFYGCSWLKDVYYTGTVDQWNKINIGNYNSCLTNANIHYNFSGSIAASGAGPADIHDESKTAANIVADVNTDADTSAPVEDNYETESSEDILAVTGADSGENDTFTRAHLAPDTEAVLIILRGYEDTAQFNAESLLYIDQGTVGADGSIQFDAATEFGDTAWVAYIFGECWHEAGNWEISREPSDSEIGLRVKTCNHCGEVLEAEDIPALRSMLLGDVDGDGEVTIVDATFIQRKLANIEIPFVLNETVADTDEDGDVTIVDVTFIQRWLVHLPSNDQIGKPI